ncbi:SurA N-terminal domain-containing protein [Candidatus Omnitrophota bacterium]
MLKFMRKKALLKIVLWSVVIAFVLGGAGSLATRRSNYAGTIFGKKIAVTEFNRVYMSVLNQAKMTYGKELSKIEKFLNLEAQAWDRLILLYTAKKRRIKAANKEVIQRIASLPFFQRNGLFDQRLYAYIIENVFRIGPRDFEESVRDDIVIEKLAFVQAKDVNITVDEVMRAYQQENEKADISFILIGPDNYKDSVAIEDNEILEFYNKNNDALMSPASVNTHYLKIPFSDQKEEAKYAAEELLGYIRAGKSIEEVAAEYDLPIRETGFFAMGSTIPEIGSSYPFVVASFTLNMNEISDVVEADDAFYIIRLVDKKPPFLPPFAEVKDKAADMLISEKAGLLAQARAKSILGQIKDDARELEDIAKDNEYDLLTKEAINRKGFIEEIGSSDSFIDIAFSLQEKEVGGPAKTEKGYAIIRLDKLTPIDQEKLEEEKDSFAMKLLQNKKSAYFQEWLVNLRREADLKTNTSQ